MKQRPVRTEVGVFGDEHTLLAAAKDCQHRGIDIVEAHSPYPIHGIDPILGIRSSRLPYWTLVGGTLGLTLSLWFQYWSSASDYPLNVGGKPFNSLPAFIPVTFEMLILFAGLLTVAGFLLTSRLFPGRKTHPIDSRITNDRFVLIVQRKDASMTQGDIQTILQHHGVLECWSEMNE